PDCVAARERHARNRGALMRDAWRDGHRSPFPAPPVRYALAPSRRRELWTAVRGRLTWVRSGFRHVVPGEAEQLVRVAGDAEALLECDLTSQVQLVQGV